jgi:cytidylate kinase
MLITISREYGAGGSQIAAAVGKRLGWPVIDNQLIDEVAQRAGLTPDEVKLREERGPTFVERLARAFAASTPQMLGSETLAIPEVDEARLAKITEQVVADAMRDHAVLVGRAAVVVVPPAQLALNVRLVASPAFRAQAVAQRLLLPLAEAERQVKDVDAHRAGYHRQYYGRDWADPRNYHMILNTEKLGFERTVELIVLGAVKT